MTEIQFMAMIATAEDRVCQPIDQPDCHFRFVDLLIDPYQYPENCSIAHADLSDWAIRNVTQRGSQKFQNAFSMPGFRAAQNIGIQDCVSALFWHDPMLVRVCFFRRRCVILVDSRRRASCCRSISLSHVSMSTLFCGAFEYFLPLLQQNSSFTKVFH